MEEFFWAAWRSYLIFYYWLYGFGWPGGFWAAVVGMIMTFWGSWLTGEPGGVSGSVVNGVLTGAIFDPKPGNAQTWYGMVFGALLRFFGIIICGTGVVAGVNAFLYG